MTVKYVNFLLIILVFISCRQVKTTQKIETQRIAIDHVTAKDTLIDAFLIPYRNRLQASMNEVLSFSVAEHKKTDGELNTAVGNLMADAVFERCAPILKKRYNIDLDMVLLNHGGIRAPLPKGAIKMTSIHLQGQKVLSHNFRLQISKIELLYCEFNKSHIF